MLTDAGCRRARLPDGVRETMVSDRDGLALRLRRGSKAIRKTWVIRYRDPVTGKQTKDQIGEYPGMSLSQARERTTELRQALIDGITPRRQLSQSRVRNASALTLSDVCDCWLSFEQDQGLVSTGWSSQRRKRWRRHLEPSLGRVTLDELERSHVAETLDAMRRKGIVQETRHALNQINKMLDFAVSRGWCEVNPARLLRPRDFGASQNRPRERYLDLDELKQFLAALLAAEQAPNLARTARLSPEVSGCLRLLVLTGIRRSVVAGMRWSELDLGRARWNIPAERMKNGFAHQVHLSKPALDVIALMERINSHREFVFASYSKPEKHIAPDTLSRAVPRLRAVHLKHLAPFSLHDLRRSAATAWGEYCNAPPHLIERMLAHLPANKLVRTYQRQRQFSDMAEVWDAWGEQVQALMDEVVAESE